MDSRNTSTCLKMVLHVISCILQIIIQVSPAPPAKNKPIQNEIILSYGKKETYFKNATLKNNMMRFYTNMQLMSISAIFNYFPFAGLL